MKRIIRISLLAALAGIFIWTFVFLYQKARPKEVSYEIEQASRRDVTLTTIATGKIEPRDEIEIKPQINGIIDKLYKQAGEKVEKDEIIARVKVIPEMGQLNAAESRMRLARISNEQVRRDFARTEKLYNEKLISREEYEKGAVAMKQSDEELQTAADNLSIVREGVTKSAKGMSNTFVRSTITGLILDVPVKKGNSVIMSNTFNNGTTIANVANMNDLLFIGDIDESEVGHLREGMPVSITIGALQNMKFDAILEYISPKSKDVGGSSQFEIKAAINVPGNVTIRSGYSANADIILQKAKQTVAIPERCVEFDGDQTYVYIPQDESYRRVAIELGVSDGIYVEVLKGLNEGDKIRGRKR